LQRRREQIAQLDLWSNDMLVDALKETGLVCTIVSEEMEAPLHVDRNCHPGSYVVCFDPVDGSSNIDINGTVGTIFSVRHRRGHGPEHMAADILRKGTEQVAAGYVMYGPSTMFIYAAGDAVHLPPRTEHQVINDTEDDLEYLNISALVE